MKTLDPLTLKLTENSRRFVQHHFLFFGCDFARFVRVEVFGIKNPVTERILVADHLTFVCYLEAETFQSDDISHQSF